MTEEIAFSEIETIRCPKCASGSGCKCWVMAGKGCTNKTKIAPHMNRVHAYLNAREAKGDD